MIRVAVINIKNLVRNFIKFIIVILLFLGIRNIVNFFIQSVSDFDYKKIINKNVFFQLEDIEVKKIDDILDIAFLTSTKAETFFNTTNTEISDEVIDNTEIVSNNLSQENSSNIENNVNIEEYKIQKNRKSKYSLVAEGKYLTGIIRLNEKGFGFVKIEEREQEI